MLTDDFIKQIVLDTILPIFNHKTIGHVPINVELYVSNMVAGQQTIQKKKKIKHFHITNKFDSL